MSLNWETAGHTPAGEALRVATLDNGRGLRARVMGYGATLLELWVPDRRGRPVDVVLGFDTAAAYLGEHPYFNVVVGRYANRIAGARFTLGGVEYRLAANNGGNHLHGGRRGFDKVVWNVMEEEKEAAVDGAADGVVEGATGNALEKAAAGPVPRVTWHYRSPAGEEGYPGNLDVRVTYTLTDDNALRLDYEARTDAATPINLTHHAYWNLAGGGDILDHELQILGARFLPVGPDLIPTGELSPVAGSPMDFRIPAVIRARLDPADPQLSHASGGYDHNWVLDGGGAGTALAARLTEPGRSIAMEVWTTQPGLQFYSGNFLDGSLAGKGGQRYGKHGGLCLETQHFPDSPNQPAFPGTVLQPGESYRQTTLYRFSTFEPARSRS